MKWIFHSIALAFNRDLSANLRGREMSQLSNGGAVLNMSHMQSQTSAEPVTCLGEPRNVHSSRTADGKWLPPLARFRAGI